MLVVWSPTALREVELIFEYLRHFNPRAAAAVATSLIKAGDDLATYPHWGSPLPNSGLREMMTAYPYVLRYRVGRDRISLLRVRHTSRRLLAVRPPTGQAPG